uniref:Uncharacterized protein n=1 Tax=Anopheles coluzzii TaxID=1518534 RepID=A0A8W7P2U4_ANOCL
MEAESVAESNGFVSCGTTPPAPPYSAIKSLVFFSPSYMAAPPAPTPSTSILPSCPTPGEAATGGNPFAPVATVFGQISVSISAIQLSRWRSNRAFDPASVSVGTLGSGGGSGVAKYRATSLAQSVYPARYLSMPGLSRLRCRWKCRTVSSSMSAFSSLECFVCPSPDLLLTVDSRMRAFRMARLWLMRARRRFSISGLLVRFSGSCAACIRPGAVVPVWLAR